MPYKQSGRLCAVFTTLDADVLLFRQMTAVEGVSELFRYSLRLLAERDATVKVEDLIGQKMTARLQLGGNEQYRFFNGIVARMGVAGVDDRFKTYDVELVPWLWLLTRTSDCRIFQEKTAVDIIEEVFGEYDFANYEFRLTEQPSQRVYCVQYRETDFQFVSRLLESEGIGYYFEHTEDGHKLILFDGPAENLELAQQPAASFRPGQGADYHDDVVIEWSQSHELRPGRFALQDYNFEDPKANLHTMASSEVTAGGADRFELYEYPGGHPDTGLGDSLAQIRVQQEAVLARTTRGYGTCRAFTPGYRFTLKDHLPELSDKPYLLTRVTHVVSMDDAYESAPGEAFSEYENTFETIPHEVPFRPQRITPAPVVHGDQTAVVVGPSGEEIFTDKYGRVKVLFHWDRKGKADEQSSCWIRCGQTLAGKQWGAVFLPRIGQEVIVSFLEGDPDRPLVTGCVYNAQYMPPYELPGEKTKSGIKTQSSTGGEGFNEIRFEDKKGEEQIFIFAQKDKDVRVLNDRYEHIGNDTHLIVTNDQKEQIDNDQHAKVGRHRSVEIGKDDNLKVSGKQALEVASSRSLTVKGDVIDVFKKNHSEQTTGDYYLKAKQVVIEASSGLTLKCGGTAVVIDASGVTLKGSLLTLDGQMVKIASGPGSSPLSGQAGSAVTPAAPGAPIEAATAVTGLVGAAEAKAIADKKASFSAAAVKPFKESSSDDDGADEEKKETTFVEIELLDESDKPVAGEKFEVKLPDGTVASGTTGSDGIARIEGVDPGDCEISFPDLDKDAWEPA